MLLVSNDPKNKTGAKNSNLRKNIAASLKNPDSQNHRNQVYLEWKAITKAKGYNGSFPIWFMDRGYEWYPGIPDLDYVRKILLIVKDDCQKTYYRHDSFCKVEFKEKVTTDFKELGGKFTYSW